MKLFCCLLFLSSGFVFSQSDSIVLDIQVVDTGTYNGRQIAIFNSGDWDYLDDVTITRVSRGSSRNGCLWFTYDQLVNTNFKVNRSVLSQLNCRMATDTIKLNVSGYVSPVNVKCNSSFKMRWGRWHQGNDYAAVTGTKVVSAWDGVVRYAQMNEGGFGNLVVVRHYNGLETYYAHLSKIEVKPYDTIRAGSVVGRVGTTGHSTGPHLHFEVRFFDSPINPSSFGVSTKEILLYSAMFPSNSMNGKPFKFSDKFNTTIKVTESLNEVKTVKKRKTFSTIQQ